DRRASRLSDGDRAVGDGAERADDGVPRIVQGVAATVRSELHRDGLQRADAAQARLRIRAGDEETGAAAVDAVGGWSTASGSTARRRPHDAASAPINAWHPVTAVRSIRRATRLPRHP